MARSVVVAVVVALTGCSAAPPPAPREAPAASPSGPAASVASAPSTGSVRAASPPPAAEAKSGATGDEAAATGTGAGHGAPPTRSWPEECHVPDELARAFEAMNPGGSSRKWIVDAGARLLEPDIAQRVLTGVSQEILSALAHRRYEKLAAFAAPEGVCMRAAKGAECKMLSAKALAGCTASRVRSPWAVDTGRDEPPSYTCGEAFQRIFYTRDYLHAPARFNCFPEAGRGNNAAPIILSGPHFGYVELYTETNEGSRSLWLVFDGKTEAPELVEMIAEYWGI